MPEYIVVSRAHSGARIGKDDAVIVRTFPSKHGPVDVLFATRLVKLPGFSKPVPMGLMSEVRGHAPTLDEAVQQFSITSQSLCPIFSLIGNTPIEDMVPEIGYDVTPGKEERDYFQHFLPEERILMVERRRIASDLVMRVLNKLFAQPDHERIRRSIAQYYQALRNWEPGQEILAIAHLWMGVEALTPVVLRRELARRSIDRTQLAEDWSIEQKVLDAEVRRRLILDGDSDSYAAGKKASDGFEHGFLEFSELQEHSRGARLTIAGHLRRTLISVLELDTDDAMTLQSAPYGQPGHLGVAKYLRGSLSSKSDQLAHPDQLHPFLKWRTTLKEEASDNSDEIKVKIEETITGVFADGVSFRPTTIEVWGGQGTTIMRRDV